jgi:predicted esterase
MNKLLLWLTVFAFYSTANAQSNFLDQIKIYKIKDAKLNEIEFGVFNKDIDKKKPLLLFLGGSGLEPSFKYNKQDKQVYYTGFYRFTKYQDKYHIVFINKAGIPLYDSVNSNNETYPASSFAQNNNTLNWRAESASKAIDYLTKVLQVDTNNIIVVGHSQGGQVAPKVASLNKKIKKVVMMSSNSLDHIYDRILIARQQALNNQMSFDEAQYVVDSLLKMQQAIYENKNSTKDFFWGDPFNKWYSYSKETPLENMLTLNIPILLIAGGRDVDGSYIANTDYAALEFIRKGKKNLTYKVYPNYDHIYGETTRKYGEEIGLGFKSNKVVDDIFVWLEKLVF